MKAEFVPIIVIILTLLVFVAGAFTGGWATFAILMITALSCLMWIFCLGAPTVGSLALLFAIKKRYFDRKDRKMEFKQILALWTLFFFILNLVWLPPFVPFEFGGNIKLILSWSTAGSIWLLSEIVFTWTVIAILFLRKYRCRPNK